MHSTLSAEEIAQLPKDGGADYNRLIFESSVYLRQHAHQAINWYAWGQEAWDLAKITGKPIFLSIGYASCHWCHVMSQESFDDAELAKILNEGFICIKVDKDEHPNVDSLYMTVTQMLTGHGGWPNTLVLSPDLKPWYAGTYFPKNDTGSQIGLMSLLPQLLDEWATDRKAVEDRAEQIQAGLSQLQHFPADDLGVIHPQDITKAVDDISAIYDDEHGGFRGAPKFPPHTSLLFLLELGDKNPRGKEMALHCLDALACGGIHDHVGGGFHRYSVDSMWLCSHYEKVLSDQALLLQSYVEAYDQTGAQRYREVIEKLWHFLSTQMQDASGGFYAALDADSEDESAAHAEGAYYLWDPEQLKHALGDVADECFAYFGIPEAGNHYDEKTGDATGKVILRIADRRDLSTLYPANIATALEKLEGIRARRPLPPLDHKIVVGWNALLISALARASVVLENELLLKAAKDSAAVLWNSAWSDGALAHYICEGTSAGYGTLEDYAAFAQGLLALADASNESEWRTRAITVLDACIQNFENKEAGGFYSSSASESALIVRLNTYYDQATPSGPGLLMQVLSSLMMDDPKYAEYFASALRQYSPLLRQESRAAHSFYLAVLRFYKKWPAVLEASNLSPLQAQLLLTDPMAATGQTINAELRIEIPADVRLLAGADQAPQLLAEDGVEILHAQWPRPSQFKDANLGVISVYTGTLNIPVLFRITPSSDTSEFVLKTELKYQLCDAQSCQPESRLTLEAPVFLIKV